MYTVVFNFGNKLWEGRTWESTDTIIKKGFATVLLAATIDSNDVFDWSDAKLAHVLLHNIVVIRTV